MPTSTIINAAIGFDGTAVAAADVAGIRIQVFERNLPSLERRMGQAPKLLGEGIVDATGGVHISCQLDQLEGDEGIGALPRVVGERITLPLRRRVGS